MATGTKRRGSNRRAPRHTQEERQAQWAAMAERLEAWKEENGGEADTEGMIAAALAMHDGYSERNAMLIAMQDPQATDVRGYRMWAQVGRQVTEYPEGEQSITIVSYRGQGKAASNGEATAEVAKPAEGTPAEGGAQGGDKKPSLRFAFTSVHDIRRTIPLFCAECGRPIHQTGQDGRFPVWTHTGLAADLGHKARKPRRGEDAPPPPAGALEVAQAWHAARAAKRSRADGGENVASEPDLSEIAIGDE